MSSETGTSICFCLICLIFSLWTAPTVESRESINDTTKHELLTLTTVSFIIDTFFMKSHVHLPLDNIDGLAEFYKQNIKSIKTGSERKIVIPHQTPHHTRYTTPHHTTPATPHHTTPHHTTPHHTTPHHTTPHHTTPHHTTPHPLHHITPYHTIPHPPHRTAPHRAAPRRAAPHHTIPYHTIPYHTIPYHTIPYHTIPYHTIPYHTIPYHTIPYHTPYHTIHISLFHHRGAAHHTIPSLLKVRQFPSWVIPFQQRFLVKQQIFTDNLTTTRQLDH